ncbi:MAG TPA: GNAT family N-acetyltransferase [Nitrospirota bacterium]|nr:GNAT family N-acetyltransferase [Nitrospirota bacterium]
MTRDDNIKSVGEPSPLQHQDQPALHAPAAPVTARIRNMARADLDRVGEILFNAYTANASKRGYAPRMQNAQEGTSWAWAMLRHAPADILIAEVEDRAVGICCLNPRGEQGGVGPVAVDPSFQGQGIGRLLMNALLARAEGLKSVRLFQEAFNPASFSLYYSLDFAPVADMLDLVLSAGIRTGTGADGTINEGTANDLDAVAAYDAPRSKLARRSDLAFYVKWGKILVYRQGAQILGFLACLPGARFVQLGPLVAEGEEVARRLFEHAAAVFSGRPCQTRVMARDTLLVRALQASGFKLYCLNILMVRGSWRPGPSIESFGGFPEGV